MSTVSTDQLSLFTFIQHIKFPELETFCQNDSASRPSAKLNEQIFTFGVISLHAYTPRPVLWSAWDKRPAIILTPEILTVIKTSVPEVRVPQIEIHAHTYTNMAHSNYFYVIFAQVSMSNFISGVCIKKTIGALNLLKLHNSQTRWCSNWSSPTPPPHETTMHTFSLCPDSCLEPLL